MSVLVLIGPTGCCGDSSNIWPCSGFTALHSAASTANRSPGRLDRLIRSRSISLEATDENGQTALHIAAKFGQDEGIRKLLAAGANVNSRDNNRQTPLSLCSCYNIEPIIPQLLLAGTRKADTEATDAWTWTPLFWAAYRDFDRTAEVLINSGANLNPRDPKGKTPLHWAAEQGSVKCMRLLLTRANERRTPLDLEAKDNWQWTPVFWATYYNRVEALQILLDQGADVNQEDPRQWTPLFWASQSGHEAAVELLLRKGADRTIIDTNGKVAKDWAKTDRTRRLFDSIPPPERPRPASPPRTTNPPQGSTHPAAQPPQPTQGSGGGSADPLFYLTPGNVEDLKDDPQGSTSWSRTVNMVIDNIISTKGGKAHFLNQATCRKTSNPEEMVIKWRAYPKNQEDSVDKWSNADIRENQDEYCEWEVKRTQKGELESVTFTTEVPEYWDHLSKCERNGSNLLVELYRNLNPGADIRYEHLFDSSGKYNHHNRWNIRDEAGANGNTDGAIAHMVCQNNTLREAADLLADCSVLYKDNNGEYIKNGSDILAKLDVSEQSAGRNSDPQIASQVANKAIQGKYLAAANPVCLYIQSLEFGQFRNTMSAERLNWSKMWKVERGSRTRAVRQTFTVPPHLLGKIKVSGRFLEYGSQVAQCLWVAVNALVVDAPAVEQQETEPIYTFIEGRHIKPIRLSDEAVLNELQKEPFGEYLAKTKERDRAISLDKLLATFERHTWVAYAADEGIRVTFKPPRTQVRVRLVIFVTPNNPTEPPEGSRQSQMANIQAFKQNVFRVPTLAIVAVPPSGDPNNYNSNKSILQIAAFTPEQGWFNWYDRERGEGGQSRWLYFGNSTDAFTPDTQGLGPFCGHANGGLIVKEPEEPWVHWHSQSASLELPKTHPMYNDPLWRNQTAKQWYFDGAEELAEMINTANEAWFNKRLSLDLGSALTPNLTAVRVHQWIAHVLLTTTVNISCSNSLSNQKIRIPSGFFLNSRALDVVSDGFSRLEDSILYISRQFYEDARKALSLQTVQKFAEERDGTDIVAADSEGFAPWKVVVPCAEDATGIEYVIRHGLLPKKVVLALLLVDFWNPVFSYRRARLMRYIPSTATLQDPSSTEDIYKLGSDLIEVVKNAIHDLELDDSNSPEAEFLRIVQTPDLENFARKKVRVYVDKVNKQLGTPGGLLGYMKVAETKRRMFRPPPRYQKPLHPLAEFDMSLPYASKFGEMETWVMKEDATVEREDHPGSDESKIWHPRNTQAHFSSAGCPFSASF